MSRTHTRDTPSQLVGGSCEISISLSMTTTARNLVSLVRADLYKFGPDRFISDRHILATLLPIINQLNSQQVSKRQVWGVDQLYTTIDCLKMIHVPMYTCCDVESDCMIARSEIKLPEIVDSYYSLIIRAVQSVDGKVKFNELNTPERYANTLKLYPKKKTPYFFMKNGYLYITDPDIEYVTITAIFKGLIDPEDFCCNSDCAPASCPTNPLDLELKYLPKLEITIINSAFQKLVGREQIPPEKNSGDLIPGN